MEEVEVLKHLHGLSLSNKDDSFSFTETGPDAKVKTLTIGANGVSFYYADGDTIKGLENLWKANKYFLLHKNADGIVVFDKDGKRYLLLCEMKSSMGQIKDKGINQVVAGYLRMAVLLSICKEKDILEHDIVFVFTSQQTSTEERKRLQEIQMLESDKDIMDKSIPVNDKILYRLYKSVGNSFEMSLRTICPDFHNDLVHLKDSLLDTKIQWKLLMPPNTASTVVQLDVNTL